MQNGKTDLLYPSKHNAVMSSLEWWQRKNDGTVHFYPSKKFEERLNTFNDLVILYATKHPLDGVKGKNLDTVLKEIDGKVVGYTSDSMINNTGTPNLRTVFNITDNEIDAKIKRGELNQSLGFRYSAPNFGFLNDVIGDHVLLYDRSLCIPQGDQGSMILNQDNSENVLGYMAGVFGGRMPSEVNNTDISGLASVLKNNMDEFNNKFLAQEAEKMRLAGELEAEKGKVLKLNQDIESLNKTMLDLNNELTTLKDVIETDRKSRIKANMDSYWNGLPEGIREQFEARKGEMENPELVFKLNQDINIALSNVPKPGFKFAQGRQEVNMGLKNNTEDDIEIEDLERF